MSCDHDSRFRGVLFLPKADAGCLACAFERTLADKRKLVECFREVWATLDTDDWDDGFVDEVNELLKEELDR